MSKLQNDIVMFASNEGGHFSQILALHDLFGRYHSVLVTDNITATKEIKALSDIEEVVYSYAMTKDRENSAGTQRRSRWNLFFAYISLFGECWHIVHKYKPKAIVSTGSNIAVPLFVWGKMRGAKLIFIETRAKVYSKSLAGKIVNKIADVMIVQWPEMKQVYPQAEYFGTLV